MRFRDRDDAGRRLGELLAGRLPDRGDGVAVLGIARGGVIVAAPVAAALETPLNVIVPRKIGAPGNPELAVGALALAGDEEFLVWDERTLAWLGVPEGYRQSEVARQRDEIRRREAAFREGRSPPAIAGRTAVVVDDGIATGLTARAAALAVGRARPAQVIVAAPVAAPETVAAFARLGLRVDALEMPSPFHAVGRFYEDFRQTEDAEVLAALRRSF